MSGARPDRIEVDDYDDSLKLPEHEHVWSWIQLGDDVIASDAVANPDRGRAIALAKRLVRWILEGLGEIDAAMRRALVIPPARPSKTLERIYGWSRR